jgi:hypothetical protein
VPLARHYVTTLPLCAPGQPRRMRYLTIRLYVAVGWVIERRYGVRPQGAG